VAEWPARRLGTEPTREAFAAAPLEALLDAQQELSGLARSNRLDPAEWGEEGPPPLPFAPVVDGDVLPEPIDVALAAGASNDVALLAGSNTDEDLLFMAPLGLVDAIDDAALEVAARGFGLDDAGLGVYRDARPGAKPGEVLAAIGSDARFRLPAIRVAESRASASAPTYLYEFAWRSPAGGGMFGACHALEIPFVFDNLDKGGVLAGENPPQELADVVHGAWVSFAGGGDPGWPPYDPERRPTMTFDLPESRLVEDPRGDERRAWQR
jgi:para-nitrobenzyl esterase